MGNRISDKVMARARRAGAAMLVAAGLLVAAGAAQAQWWNLHTVLEPPVLPDVDPANLMGFGAAVSVGSTPWLAVGAPRADCPDPKGLGILPDTGRIFIYKRINGVWHYHQSFCAATPVTYSRYGSSLDMSQSWLIVGAPGAAQGMRGSIEMFHLDPGTGQWTRRLTTSGLVDGYLGQSVAIDRGLAVAGEPGYDTFRGRLRTWKLSGASVTAQAHYAPAGLVDFDRYGRKVAVQSNGCELPTCTSFTDVAIAHGGSKLYVAKRTTTGWQASQTLSAPSGAEFLYPGASDVSHYQIVATLQVQSPTRMVGCPVGRAVRVYHRTGGNFSVLGDACPAPTADLGAFGSAVAADRGTTTFQVGTPEAYPAGMNPAPLVASVATFAGHPAITYIDAVPELGLAPSTGLGLEVFYDHFGASVSTFSSYMAVGAPWRQVYFGFPGVGYVVIYHNCC